MKSTAAPRATTTPSRSSAPKPTASPAAAPASSRGGGHAPTMAQPAGARFTAPSAPSMTPRGPAAMGKRLEKSS